MSESNNKNVRPSVTMSDKEKREYSLAKGILSLVENTNSLAKEISDDLYVKSAGIPGVRGGGLMVPYNQPLTNGVTEQFRRRYAADPRFRAMKRDITTVGAGASDIFTVPGATTPIEFLYALTPILSTFGVRKHENMPSQFALPRVKTSGQARSSAEDLIISSSNLVYDQVKFTPHTYTALQPITRQMLAIAATNVEADVMYDINSSFAVQIEADIINGASGGNGVTGITNYGTGVQSGSLSSGKTSGSMFYQDALNGEAALANANVPAPYQWLTSPNVRGKLKVTPQIISSSFPVFVWDRTDDDIAGYPATVTSNVPNNLGTNSDSNVVILGNWTLSDFATFGQGMEILVDPYSASTQGIIRLTAFLFCDFQLRHPQAFWFLNQVLTTVNF